ncbi:MAG: hypothetical protein ACRD1L_12340, partial [Terriglobales bacterium]
MEEVIDSEAYGAFRSNDRPTGAQGRLISACPKQASSFCGMTLQGPGPSRILGLASHSPRNSS